MDQEHNRQAIGPRRRSLVHSAAWNYAGYAYQIVLNFGLTAYIVRHISVAEYGIFVLVMSLSATMNLLDLGISGVLVQKYVYAIKQAGNESLNRLVSTVLVALAGLGFLGAGIFCGLAMFLPGPFRIPSALLHQAVQVFFVAALIVQVRLPIVALRQALQAHERFDRINQFALVTSTVQAALSIAALVAGLGLVGLALAQLASALLQFAIFVIAFRMVAPEGRIDIFRFDPRLLKTLLADGKWAFASNVTGYLVEMAIWGALGSMASMTEAALYGVAMKAPNQLWNLADRGADVLLPVLSGLSAEKDHAGLRKLFLSTQQLIFGAVLPFVVLGAFFASPLLHLWFGRQYTNGSPAMRWWLLAVAAHAVAYSSDLMLYACGRFQRATWISVVGGAFTCVGAVLLVPRYGAAGAAASLAVSELLIDCGWFTWEACRVSHTPVPALARSLLRGLGLPLLVLVAAAAIILGLGHLLTPALTIVAATVSGLLYFALWGYRTAWPLYRGRVEVAAS